MKTKVSKAQYLQLVGVLALAEMYHAKLRDLHDAARAITEEQDNCGHTNDAVYSDFDADALLRKLKITVKG
jgi:hypothetical protein